MTIPTSYPIYPFSALVGQERLKRALILNAINPRIGGVLIRGEKGTAKSTAVRGLARLLPPIQVVEGCAYHCDPDKPAGLCSTCINHLAGAPLPIYEQPTKLVELPVSASEDRVVGSLDIEHAITEGQRRFEPGLLAQVNRGLLYVDEVNLLDDHLVDLLLDSAAMGVNTVEREGVSISHPARFILVGTMNPEEGELRPQLLDRFGLAVEVTGLCDVESRTLVIERRLAYEASPEQFVVAWEPSENELSARIVAAQVLLPQVSLRKSDMQVVARLALELQVDGHRADLTILETARTHAAWEGRQKINKDDLHIAAELALPHRMRRQPFTEVGGGKDGDFFQTAVEHSWQAYGTVSNEQNEHEVEKKTVLTDDDESDTVTEAAPNAEWDGEHVTVGISGDSGTQAGSASYTGEEPSSSGMVYEANTMFQARKLEGRSDYKFRVSAGRRSKTCSSSRQGRYISSRRVERVTDLAFDATLRAAAPYQLHRRMQKSLDGLGDDIHTRQPPQNGWKPKCIIIRDDLRQKIRVRRTRNAVCFVVDASWSMAAEERMCATKAAVLSLLRDAYQRRDYVGIVSFQRTYASILLPLTNSVELAQSRLAMMPIGGKTPLTQGLLTGYQILERARRQNPEIIPMLVILTDGQANVAMSNLPPQIEAYRVAEYIAKRDVQAVVVDTEYVGGEFGPSSMISAHASRAQMRFSSLESGLARHLAEYLKGFYYRLEDLTEGGLAQVVRTHQIL